MKDDRIQLSFYAGNTIAKQIRLLPMTDANEQPELKIDRLPWMERLKRDIQVFHEKTGMKHSTITMKAIGNGHVWKRLHEGGDITVSKADQLYAWMAEQGYNFNS